jgi:hypothetical protein
VLAAVDKANGYSFAVAVVENMNKSKKPLGEEHIPSSDQLFRMVGSNSELSYFRSLDVMEKYSKS